MTIKELKKMIIKAIEKSEKDVAELSGSDNPQTIDFCIRAQERLDAYKEVLQACNNSTFNLKISGGDF